MHYYERTIIEIKNEYTEILLNILTPLIYEGIKKLYDQSKTISDKRNPNIEKKIDILQIFQLILIELPSLNNNLMEDEVKRIKEASKCSEYFEYLIKATFKSYIIVLTCNTSEETCELIKKKLHNLIDINKFIHKCYIESAKTFYNYPELFDHSYPILELKRNKREIHALIKESIKDAIRKMLPLKAILKEYLRNDYVKKPSKIIYSDSEENEQKNKNGVDNIINNIEENLNIKNDLFNKKNDLFNKKNEDLIQNNIPIENNILKQESKKESINNNKNIISKALETDSSTKNNNDIINDVSSKSNISDHESISTIDTNPGKENFFENLLST
jgi:hypothetical protein